MKKTDKKIVDDNAEDQTSERPIVAKSAVDLQRLKLMKLMKNPEKPVVLPDRPRTKSTPSVPEFVRNVMGSSAGAGSGEFHVYRHLRRKEYARQKFIQEKSKKELLDLEYKKKIDENKLMAAEKTAKKRAKRLKRKGKIKKLKMNNEFKNKTKTENDHKLNEKNDDSDHDDDSDNDDKNEVDNNPENDDTKIISNVKDCGDSSDGIATDTNNCHGSDEKKSDSSNTNSSTDDKTSVDNSPHNHDNESNTG